DAGRTWPLLIRAVMARRDEVVLVALERQAVLLVGQVVELVAVVGAPGTAEQDVALVAAQVVGTAQARREAILERIAVAAVADVVLDVVVHVRTRRDIVAQAAGERLRRDMLLVAGV